MLNYSCIRTNQLINNVNKSPDAQVFGDLFLSSCPGIGKDLLGDIQIIKDLNIKCLISLMEKDELNHFGAGNLFKELDQNKIKWIQLILQLTVIAIDKIQWDKQTSCIQ